MPDPEHIRGWQRLDARTTTSGRIEQADVTALAGLGIRRVINLAMPDHPDALADEAHKLAAAGIAYTHIPVPFAAPDDSHFAAFCTAYEASGDAPVHVHCIMNWRVSAFFYRYNCMVRGMDEAAARCLMAQQWCPETNPHPDAPAWVRFIAQGQV
jgi:uncharacterized protein (TIGR01244 family)